MLVAKNYFPNGYCIALMQCEASFSTAKKQTMIVLRFKIKFAAVENKSGGGGSIVQRISLIRRFYVLTSKGKTLYFV